MPAKFYIYLLYSAFTSLMALLSPSVSFSQSNLLVNKNGQVDFMSDAPLEIIRAHSDEVIGAIDKSKNSFAFGLHIQSFKGFNSDLQREHFHENYMETERYPVASFSGKFIDPVDFNTNGIYPVRAKGNLQIHGVDKERIIKGTITVKNNVITINASFIVSLEDHNIKVPRIVYQKIAQQIIVEIKSNFVTP